MAVSASSGPVSVCWTYVGVQGALYLHTLAALHLATMTRPSASAACSNPQPHTRKGSDKPYKLQEPQSARNRLATSREALYCIACYVPSPPKPSRS